MLNTQRPSSPTSDHQRLPPRDDSSGHGLVSLPLAIASTLAVTAAIVLLALIQTPWVAAFAAAALITLTGVVVAAALHAASTGPNPPGTPRGSVSDPEPRREPPRQITPTTKPTARR